MWREDEMYERWAMAIYRQLATESPMPQRLYAKQVEREMEEEEKEREASTVDSSAEWCAAVTVACHRRSTLSSSSSFSSLLSLLHTPSSNKPPTHSTSITALCRTSASHTPLRLAALRLHSHSHTRRTRPATYVNAPHSSTRMPTSTTNNPATTSPTHYLLPPSLMLVRKHKRGLFSSDVEEALRVPD